MATKLMKPIGPGTLKPKQAVKIFVSYAHLDKVWMRRLEPLLKGLQWDDRRHKLGRSVNEVRAWHDKDLKKGVPFDPAIKKELEEMHVFVPLVSHDFFASWYVQEIELPHAVQCFEEKKILVLPVLLEEVNLEKKCEFLHQFPSVPTGWWGQYDDNYSKVLREIDDALWDAIEGAAKLL